MLAQSKYFLYNTAVLKNKQKWLKMQIKKIHAIVETLFLPKIQTFPVWFSFMWSFIVYMILCFLNMHQAVLEHALLNDPSYKDLSI